MRRALLRSLVFAGIFASTLSPAFANQCSISKDCGSASPAQCQGTSCKELSNGVECDGLPDTCASSGTPGLCYLQYDCPAPPFSKPFILFCGGTSCDTSGHSIRCENAIASGYPSDGTSGDWTIYTCSGCENHPNECDQAAW